MTVTAPPAPHAGLRVGDPAGLRRALAEIDRLGWDSPPGDAVLRYAYTHVVLPAVRRARLPGPAATDAASTGWVAAWRMLTRPGLGGQRSPWGLVASAVRREVAGDRVAAAYRTNTRRAWRLARLRRTCADPTPCGRARTPSPASGLGTDAGWLHGLPPQLARCPLSLDGLTERGWEPAATSTTSAEELGPRLALVVDALAGAGWPPALAASSVAWIAAAATETPPHGSADLPGWRQLAKRTGLPAWRTRRLAALLLGFRGTPGLLERMVRDGEHVLRQPAAQRDVRSTVHRWLPSPCAARQTTDRSGAEQAAA